MVLKVMDHEDNKIYALKCLDKKQLMREKQLKYAISESKILRQLSHPFIVKLHNAFQDKNNLYLQMEYCPYGDLQNLIRLCGRIHENIARIYFGELVLALEYVHSLDIIFRDLKPANIILDEQGFAKLTDFGLAK